MEIALLLTCSIIVARYLEKRMKVASIAHAVLFAFLFVFYVLGSDAKIFVTAMTNLFGKQNYKIIHECVKEQAVTVHFSLGALFTIEIVTYGLLLIISFIFFIKKIEKLLAKVKISSPHILNWSFVSDYNTATNDIEKNSQKTYLVLCQLRN